MQRIAYLPYKKYKKYECVDENRKQITRICI